MNINYNSQNNAFGFSAIGNPMTNPASRVAAIEFDQQPMLSNTNTDSAGGEAFDNQEEDVYKVLQSNRARNVPCDQDVPLLPVKHEGYFK